MGWTGGRSGLECWEVGVDHNWDCRVLLVLMRPLLRTICMSWAVKLTESTLSRLYKIIHLSSFSVLLTHFISSLLQLGGLGILPFCRVRLSVRLSVHPSVRSSFRLSFRPSVRLPVCPSALPSVPPVCPRLQMPRIGSGDIRLNLEAQFIILTTKQLTTQLCTHKN